MEHPEIFISYSRHDDGLAVTEVLDQFFQERGITIIRDNREIGYKESIKDYMQRLGRGKYVVVVLSDAYFKSKSCMFELLQLAEHADVYDRIFPVTVAGTSIYEAEDILEYRKYWRDKKNKLEALMREDDLDHQHGVRDDLDLYATIHQNIPRLLDFLRDLNTHPLQGNNFEPLWEKIQAKIEADRHRLEQEEPMPTVIKPPETTHDPTVLRDRYLKWLMYKTGYVPLTSIVPKNVASKVESSLNLHAIYTALLTSEPEQAEESLQARLTDSEKGRRLSALAQLNRHQHLVLLGDPGSGKSTFVNFVLMCLAGELLGDPIANLPLLTNPLPNDEGEPGEKRQPWNAGPLLPVRVILRDFAARGVPADGTPAKAKHLLEFIAQELAKETPGAFAPYLEEHLQNHGGLLMLDGLDEVPDPDRHRPQIKQAVEEFADLFPLCRFVVTSRTYAYQETDQEMDQKRAWKLRNFAEATLSVFTAGQIRCFVKQWYQYMAPLLGLRHDAAMQQADNLQADLFGNDRLRELAERPLLLTQMAILHATWQGKLPQKRVELYKETVDLLLDRWDRGKFEQDSVSYPSLSAWLQVDQGRLLGLLSKLACEVHARQSQPESHTADIPLEKLAGGLLAISPKQLRQVFLIEHLRDRAGLLVLSSTKEDAYTFPHRSFQEYLAARHLTDAPNYPANVDTLVRQDLNRWREVVLLAGAKSAIGTGQSIWNLADALCYQDVQNVRATPEDARITMLAGQALAETANLKQVDPYNHPKLKRIREWLVAILTEQVPQGAPFPAVERALAGNILAQLGDPQPGVGLRPDGLPDIEWCDVPAGTFLMGSNDYNNEKPPHKVHVSAFRISRYPVTNAQYRVFIEDGGYAEKEYWTKEGWKWKGKNAIMEPAWAGGVFDLDNHPVVRVSWYEIAAFCQWLTLRLREKGELVGNEEIRLPTEAEWEKAARGGHEQPDQGKRRYPWGDTIDPEHANYHDTKLVATSAVGCFPRGRSPYGCDDMAGNIWEWCVDTWHENYKGASTDGSAWEESGDSHFRLLRGGSWRYRNPHDLRCALRYNREPDFRYNNLGGRVVVGGL